MSHLIRSETPESTWLEAGQYILDRGSEFNLVVEISNPLSFDMASLNQLQAKRREIGAENLADVRDTIFPEKTWINSRGDRATFYPRYLRAYRTLHHRDPSSWGTYFYRMISFGSKGHNQLEEIISKLKLWKNNPHAALYLHISSRDLDAPRPLRSPCLQYVEFLCPSKHQLSMLAVYRNHDFFNKALANYIGLAKLLSFVANATEREVDSLTCHSAHAYFNSTKTQFADLIELHRQ